MPSLSISTVDRHSKRTSMIVGIDSGATDPEVQAVADAIDAVILGASVSAIVTTPNVVDAGSAVPPSDVDANRGNKWLLRIQDDTNGKIFTHEIGTADNSLLATASDDFLDITADEGLALKTAIETIYESPYGNTGTLLSVQQVNRAANN